MCKLLPSITENHFEQLNTEIADTIETRFGYLIDHFHEFLNNHSCLKDIQTTRNKSNRDRAFGTFGFNPNHWYSYNHGGRREAQFNIGMSLEYFRIGIGFNFSMGKGGNPSEVSLAYTLFKNAIEQDRDGFEKFAITNCLEIPYTQGPEAKTQYAKAENVTEWLINPPYFDEWIFVGRLLRRNTDKEILEDPSNLKDVMESVFGGFIPYWEKAQMGL